MKIVVAPGFEPGEEALTLLRGVARVTVLEDGSEAVLLEELRDAAAFLVGIEPRVTRRLIESAPRLKHIARQGVGVDIVYVQAATDRGIFVTNVPDVTSDSVAEFAMTLLLSLAKNIIRCNNAVKGGRWEGNPFPIYPAPNGLPVHRWTPQANFRPAQQRIADPGQADRDAFPRRPATP